MRHRERIVSCALGAGALFMAVARAEEPIKDSAALAARLASLGKTLAEKRVALAKKLDKAKLAREAFEEAHAAIDLDPDCKWARERLGFKKEGAVWLGAPLAPEPSKDALPADLAKQRDKDRKDGAAQLAALALRARLGGLEDDARRVAGLALDEHPDDKAARGLLGHERAGSSWTSARERSIRAAFAKYTAAAPAPAGTDLSPDDKALETLAGFGALRRLGAPHYTALATKEAPGDLAVILRAAEASRASWLYFMAGIAEGFGVEGEPARQASGAGKAPGILTKYLLVTKEQHADFVDKVVADKGERVFSKKLTGHNVRLGALPGNPLVVESHFKPELQSEWAAANVANVLQAITRPKDAPSCDFLGDGVRRFFGGHVSGRADIVYSSAGVSSGKRAFTGGTLDDLRAQVRPLVQSSFEGDLRGLLSKGVNQLESADSALAFAFVDWCLAKKRGELATFFSSLRKEDPVLKTFEAAFKASVEEVERAFESWAREEF